MTSDKDLIQCIKKRKEKEKKRKENERET